MISVLDIQAECYKSTAAMNPELRSESWTGDIDLESAAEK